MSEEVILWSVANWWSLIVTVCMLIAIIAVAWWALPKIDAFMDKHFHLEDEERE